MQLFHLEQAQRDVHPPYETTHEVSVQRIFISLFRFNSVLLHNSFELDDRSEH